MAERYLIVSDLHLCDVEEHRDGWKFFKSTRYIADEAFADLVDRFLVDSCADDRSTMILNGDVFDFDLVTALPSVAKNHGSTSWIERRSGLSPTAEKSVWKLHRVIEHHPLFLETIAHFIAAGGRIVYVLGNHDREMHFEAVQEAFGSLIQQRLARAGKDWNGEGLTFEPWFYRVPGVLYAEHGNQYDPFTCYRDVLCPTIVVRGEERLALPMGNLSNRYLLSRIGRFNPFSGDYIRSGASYVHHWIRYYALSKRSLVFNWLFGALLVFLTLLRSRRLESLAECDDQDGLREMAERSGLPLSTVRDLKQLQCSPVCERTFRMMRELWLDRVLVWLLMSAGITAVCMSNWPLWLQLVLPLFSFPLVYFLYEHLVRRDSIFDVRDRIPTRAERIAHLLDVPLVTFGHDHVPKTMKLSNGSTFVDSGTWAPITVKDKKRSLAPGYRNYLVAVAEEGRVSLTVETWPNGSAEEPDGLGPQLNIQSPARSCA